MIDESSGDLLELRLLCVFEVLLTQRIFDVRWCHLHGPKPVTVHLEVALSMLYHGGTVPVQLPVGERDVTVPSGLEGGAAITVPDGAGDRDARVVIRELEEDGLRRQGAQLHVTVPCGSEAVDIFGSVHDLQGRDVRDQQLVLPDAGFPLAPGSHKRGNAVVHFVCDNEGCKCWHTVPKSKSETALSYNQVVDDVTCPCCGTAVPSHNFTLHVAHCERGCASGVKRTTQIGLHGSGI